MTDFYLYNYASKDSKLKFIEYTHKEADESR